MCVLYINVYISLVNQTVFSRLRKGASRKGEGPRQTHQVFDPEFVLINHKIIFTECQLGRFEYVYCT